MLVNNFKEHEFVSLQTRCRLDSLMQKINLLERYGRLKMQTLDGIEVTEVGMAVRATA